MALRVGLGPGQLEVMSILLLFGLGKSGSAGREGWSKGTGESRQNPVESSALILDSGISVRLPFGHLLLSAP